MHQQPNPFANAGPVEGFLRLTADGKWLYKGEPITHSGLVDILNTNFHREDDRYVVHLKLPQGTQKVAVEIEDVPYFVNDVSVHGRHATVTLNDGTREPLDANHIRIAANGATYVRVKGGAAEARLRRKAELHLAHVLEERNGKLGVVLDGHFHQVRQEPPAS